MLRLILKENFFRFNGKHYLETHRTAMSTKTAVSLANIFMAYIETTTLSKTVFRTTILKSYIHNIFSPWDMSKPDIEAFIEQASLHHPTIEFTAETFDTETAFLDTVVYKGTRFKEKSILDAKTHFKQTETFLHTHFTSCHPPNVKKEFVKGEALRILRKNSSETTFEEKHSNFKKRLMDRGYPQTLIENLLLEIKFTDRESKLLKQNKKE